LYFYPNSSFFLIGFDNLGQIAAVGYLDMARWIYIGVVLENINVGHKDFFTTIAGDVHILKKRLEVIIIIRLVFIKHGVVPPQDLVTRDTADGKHIFFIPRVE